MPSEASSDAIERVCRAIWRRAYTEAPGGDWTTVDPGADSGTPIPTFYGDAGRARIFSTADGAAFDVRVFAHNGDEMWHRTYASMDAAFRNGKRVAEGS